MCSWSGSKCESRMLRILRSMSDVLFFHLIISLRRYTWLRKISDWRSRSWLCGWAEICLPTCFPSLYHPIASPCQERKAKPTSVSLMELEATIFVSFYSHWLGYCHYTYVYFAIDNWFNKIETFILHDGLLFVDSSNPLQCIHIFRVHQALNWILNNILDQWIKVSIRMWYPCLFLQCKKNSWI